MLDNKPPYIEVSNLGHVFDAVDGDVEALRDLDFEVRTGEFISVVGPSGCGKSTLAMLLAGLIMPTRGRIAVGGGEVKRPLTDVGIVFQSPVLLAWRSALNNVLLQVEMRGHRTSDYRERALKLLSRVGLSGFERRLPHELSGGMRQRVSICRALIHDPPLLLMDEPFGALDAITRDQLAVDTQRLCADGRKTVVFITHSITEAVFLSDRIIVMTPRPGRIDKVIEVNLPRPRRLTVRTAPLFLQYTSQIHERFLAHGIVRDLDDEEDPL